MDGEGFRPALSKGFLDLSGQRVEDSADVLFGQSRLIGDFREDFSLCWWFTSGFCHNDFALVEGPSL